MEPSSPNMHSDQTHLQTHTALTCSEENVFSIKSPLDIHIENISSRDGTHTPRSLYARMTKTFEALKKSRPLMELSAINYYAAKRNYSEKSWARIASHLYVKKDGYELYKVALWLKIESAAAGRYPADRSRPNAKWAVHPKMITGDPISQAEGNRFIFQSRNRKLTLEQNLKRFIYSLDPLGREKAQKAISQFGKEIIKRIEYSIEPPHPKEYVVQTQCDQIFISLCNFLETLLLGTPFTVERKPVHSNGLFGKIMPDIEISLVFKDWYLNRIWKIAPKELLEKLKDVPLRITLIVGELKSPEFGTTLGAIEFWTEYMKERVAAQSKPAGETAKEFEAKYGFPPSSDSDLAMKAFQDKYAFASDQLLTGCIDRECSYGVLCDMSGFVLTHMDMNPSYENWNKKGFSLKRHRVEDWDINNTSQFPQIRVDEVRIMASEYTGIPQDLMNMLLNSLFEALPLLKKHAYRKRFLKSMEPMSESASDEHLLWQVENWIVQRKNKTTPSRPYKKKYKKHKHHP